MKKFTLQVLKFSYFFGAFFVLLSGHVYAYIDPSAVTYIIQAVAAVVIALGAAATIFRHKITKFFKKNKETEKRQIHVKEEE